MAHGMPKLSEKCLLPTLTFDDLPGVSFGDIEQPTEFGATQAFLEELTKAINLFACHLGPWAFLALQHAIATLAAHVGHVFFLRSDE